MIPHGASKLCAASLLHLKNTGNEILVLQIISQVIMIFVYLSLIKISLGKHPLQEEIGNMPEAEISKRIRELTKKLATAKRWLRNPEMIAQLQNALLSYQDEMRRRRLKNWQDEYKKARGEPDMGDLINIE